MTRFVSKGVFVALAFSFAGSALAADDPFLWLEERTGDKALAWVAEQNARTAAELRSDPRYEDYVDAAVGLFTATDNLAYGYVQGDHVYNFWQDGEHNLGLWRRTTPASYKSAAPEWETIMDFDALAAAEGVDWVFSNATCAPPDYQRCLISLSPDGGDAVEVREFDLSTKSFVNDGFFSPVSKSDLAWFDPDSVILSPAYSEDQVTSSGYSRIVKLWKRGTPTEAETLFEGDVEDGWVLAYIAWDGEHHDLILDRGLDFYRTEFHVRLPDGSLKRIPLPEDAVIQQHFDGQLVFSPRSDWTLPDGRTLQAGGLYSFDFRRWLHDGELGTIDVLIEPTAKTAIVSTARTKDRLFVSSGSRSLWRSPTMATSPSAIPIRTAPRSHSASPIS